MRITLLSLAPFGAVTVASLLRPPQWQAAPGRLALTVAYVLLLTLAALRGVGVAGYTSRQAITESLTFAILAFMALAIFSRDSDASVRARSFRALCWAPLTYVWVNLLLFFIGGSFGRTPPPEASTPAGLITALGFPMSRTFFPLAVGVNTYGLVAAAALCIATVLALRTAGRERKLAALSSFAALVTLLMLDSKGPLFFSLAAIAFIVVLPRAAARRLSLLGLLIPLSPAVMLGVFGLLSNSSLVSTLSRGQASLATGTDRLYIWQPIFAVLNNFSLEHIFGYGAFGQVSSGAALHYQYLVPLSQGSFIPGAHNFVLQETLNMGYTGLLCGVALFVSGLLTFGAHAIRGAAYATVMLAALVYLILAGFTEATPTTNSPETLWLFLLMAGAASRRDPLLGFPAAFGRKLPDGESCRTPVSPDYSPVRIES